jgi:adenosine deaminase
LQAADTHREAFEYAIGNDIKRTCHAGEARGSESVDEVLKLFQPHRIGHGVRAVENPATVKRLLDENIHLEICPTSNLLTGIFDKMESHSIRQLHETGVSLGINTDGRAISDVNLTDEMNKLRSAIGFSKSDFHCFSQSAIEHAFAPREIIRSVAADLQTEWKGKS